MKAAMWYGRKDVRVVDIETPVVKAGTVKIQVSWCGICGSDLHEYIAGPMTIPVGTPHPLTGQVAPVVLGHEFSGQVVDVGEGVTHVQVGDRVVVEPVLSCGQCSPCQSGRYNLCVHRGFHGLTSDGGGFSEYTVVQANLVHKLPESLSFEAGAIVEPAAVAVQAVYSSGIRLGDTCVVFGAGPIGLLVIQAARAAGASTVIVVEVSEQRLAKAKQLGATYVINPQREEPLAVILELTGGHGVDVSFEAAGAEAALTQALECLKPGGELVVVSLWERGISLHPNLLVLNERKISSSAAYCRMFPRVMSLMTSGQINAEALISKKIYLGDIVAEGFETLWTDKSQSKILVRPR
ncbi:(R,R)-butanediol dehydrogenase [Alicyclobacillus acidoterrestris]|uniref:2,3-butanediol dehydrogenase n=1 Tax=Alicyclobacillus suci TaxID=2816080 RepID=UPI0011931035|nr:2,3-butanediol dehydrogenase [Alicyclobacillus suci]GEO26445.1 (R,R)-butanediol dehydrogenase [Alicyclobacillus acidoterrestris]